MEKILTQQCGNAQTEPSPGGIKPRQNHSKNLGNNS